MQMNDQLRRELTETLAEHLSDRSETRPYGGTWEQIAQDAMEFIYGETTQETQPATDRNHGSGLCSCGDCGPRSDTDPAGITLLGVVDPPTTEDLPTLEEFRSRFVYAVDPRYVTAVPDPAPGSGSVQTAP